MERLLRPSVEKLDKAQESQDWTKPPPWDRLLPPDKDDDASMPATLPDKFESVSDCSSLQNYVTAPDCSSSQTYVTAVSDCSSPQTYATAPLHDSSFETAPSPSQGPCNACASGLAAAPLPEASSALPNMVDIDEAPDLEPSFRFSVPIPHALVTETSPLTTDVIQIADEAVKRYDAVSDAGPISALSPEALEEHFCILSDLKNAVIMRRAAVLAELGKCAEFMSYLLTFNDQDNIILEGAIQKIKLIQQASQDHGLNLNFVLLEFARSLRSDYGRSFMEEELERIADEKDGDPAPTSCTRECIVRTMPGTLNVEDEDGLNTDDALGLGGRGVDHDLAGPKNYGRAVSKGHDRAESKYDDHAGKKVRMDEAGCAHPAQEDCAHRRAAVVSTDSPTRGTRTADAVRALKSLRVSTSSKHPSGPQTPASLHPPPFQHSARRAAQAGSGSAAAGTGAALNAPAILNAPAKSNASATRRRLALGIPIRRHAASAQ
ncbi:hypothetical protein HYPSUDRAFT_200232 [Hypholoma sublateritium FD-334 SS-4]|uniref:Uncharacterized protein n=1 Tax=Hypholoma sublateritium (strain FD-334 SS-4) TaxID=945553 RepID=A0A0D2P8M6_HYPSF|nr:hypothetical protein HYPSUDRAFT_200232 [Hypholoma sublateritium FD-334 SS-4]